ncbi:hypothetical protein V6N13_071694 [Hibiscus sabdariffa]
MSATHASPYSCMKICALPYPYIKICASPYPYMNLIPALVVVCEIHAVRLHFARHLQQATSQLKCRFCPHVSVACEIAVKIPDRLLQMPTD